MTLVRHLHTLDLVPRLPVLLSWDLALAALLLVIPAVISIGLRLGLERRLLVASLRTVLQLGLIGLVLREVFAIRAAGLVVALDDNVGKILGELPARGAYPGNSAVLPFPREVLGEL